MQLEKQKQANQKEVDAKDEEVESKGFNPKQIIHAIGFMLAGISVMGLLYMCLKMIEFLNK